MSLLTFTRPDVPVVSERPVILRARIHKGDPHWDNSPWAGREQYVRKELPESDLTSTLMRWTRLRREIVSCVWR